MDRQQYLSFISKLNRFSRTKIILCNALDSVAESLVPRQFVVDLIDWWRGIHNWRFNTGALKRRYGQDEGDLLLDSLQKLLFTPQPEGFRDGTPKPQFLLMCEKSSGTQLPPFFARVMSSTDFISYNLAEPEKKRLAAESAGLMFNSPGECFEFDLHANSYLGNPSGVSWFTPWDHFVESTSGRCADSACAALGLLGNYRTNDKLIAIQIPKEAIESTRHVRPSFADAGTHMRFRVRPDCPTKRALKPWGHTVNLDAFAEGLDMIDGLQEQIVPTLHAKSLKRAKVQYLGRMSKEWGSTSRDNHKAFASRLSQGRNENELIIEMMAIYDDAA